MIGPLYVSPYAADGRRGTAGGLLRHVLRISLVSQSTFAAVYLHARPSLCMPMPRRVRAEDPQALLEFGAWGAGGHNWSNAKL